MSLKAQRQERSQNIVLVAEDDFYMRQLVSIALEGIATVIPAESGDAVLSLYKEHNPDVLLLDIHLPKVSGKQLLAEVLAYDSGAYVVMLSADSKSDNVHGLISAGARGFVAKPFTKETLLKYLQPCSTLHF